jgi:MFS transporter, ACS family, tartrate transporter
VTLRQTVKEVSMGSGPMIASTSTGTKTIQKMQIRILAYLFLLYVISYLDRINIGFAALTMNRELAITSQQFGLLVGIFFRLFPIRDSEQSDAA